MRLAGIILAIVGVVALAAGLFSGCGTLFSWNGRHPVDVRALPLGESKQPLVPQRDRRYTLSVQVVFAREGLPEQEGNTVVEAKLPLIVRVKDRSGTMLAETIGWFDPNEPPTVLYGQAPNPQDRARKVELVAERLVGPFATGGLDPLEVTVDLGADRVGSATILERRLVIYDDALPPSVRLAVAAAAFGVVSLVVSFGLLVVAFIKRRTKRRGGIRSRKVV